MVDEVHEEEKIQEPTAEELNYDEDKKHLRDQQYEANKDMTENHEEEDPDDEEIAASMAGEARKVDNGTQEPQTAEAPKLVF